MSWVGRYLLSYLPTCDTGSSGRNRHGRPILLVDVSDTTDYRGCFIFASRFLDSAVRPLPNRSPPSTLINHPTMTLPNIPLAALCGLSTLSSRPMF